MLQIYYESANLFCFRGFTLNSLSLFWNHYELNIFPDFTFFSQAEYLYREITMNPLTFFHTSIFSQILLREFTMDSLSFLRI